MKHNVENTFPNPHTPPSVSSRADFTKGGRGGIYDFYVCACLLQAGVTKSIMGNLFEIGMTFSWKIAGSEVDRTPRISPAALTQAH